MSDGCVKTTLHARKASPQVFLLGGKRRFQNAFENLLMTKL